MFEEELIFPQQMQNEEVSHIEKQFNPDLWKPLNIKPVVPQKNYNIRETHSFLGVSGKDINTQQIVYGFGETPREPEF